jgi:hypothetical protein
MSVPVVFHQYLKDLYKHEIYIPLCLFTSPNLDYINSNASSLEMSKTNTPFSIKEQVWLLNVVSLIKACYREEEMDRGQWQEAARNWISFMGIVEGEDSVQQARWDNHFAYFEKSQNAEVNFPAILLADISIRKSYNTQPFTFDIDTYRHKLDSAIATMHLDKLRNDFTDILQYSPELLRGPPNSCMRPPGSQEGRARGGARGGRGAGGPRGGGRSGGRGSAPFQGGNRGGAATSVCLICTRRGHGFTLCTYDMLANGTPVHSTARDNDIIARSGDVLCRAWNIKGPRTTCTHGDADKPCICLRGEFTNFPYFTNTTHAHFLIYTS